jgi:hypothetical protein
LRKDFQGPLDVIPVSDPQVFSDIQRFAQLQMVAARAQGNPLYDQRKVEELILERSKIPNAKDLLIPAPKPEEMNAINENVAAALGRPIAAFPEQDHLAHLQAHLDFLTSPMFGQLQIITPNYVQVILPHIREHMVLWYVNQANEMSQGALAPQGKKIEDLMKQKDPGVQQEIDKLLATISPELVEEANKVFAKLPPIVNAAVEVAKKYAPQPVDPAVQVAQIQERIEDKKLEAKKLEVQQREEGSTQRTIAKEQSGQQKTEKQLASAEQIAQFKEQHADARNLTDNEVRERMNQQDNLTAMTIASAEIEQDGNTALQTGGGINPGEGK